MSETKAKYGNRGMDVDGQHFDSKAEGRRYAELLLLERHGAITGVSMQPPFELAPSVTLDGRKRPPLRYTADFCYLEGGQLVVEDVKSPATKTTAYRIRRHLMKAVHGIEVREVEA